MNGTHLASCGQVCDVGASQPGSLPRKLQYPGTPRTVQRSGISNVEAKVAEAHTRSRNSIVRGQ